MWARVTYRAIARYEQYRNRYQHVLRADIYRYFPAIDHAILKADLRSRIACTQANPPFFHDTHQRIAIQPAVTQRPAIG